MGLSPLVGLQSLILRSPLVDLQTQALRLGAAHVIAPHVFH